MAELGWKSHPIEPPEAIDKLIAELKASGDDRNLEWEIDYTIGEAHALFRAEVVLLHTMRNKDIDPETRAKRQPFIDLAARIVEAERNVRLDELWLKIGKLRNLGNGTK